MCLFSVDAGHNIKITTVPKHVRERAKRALSTETVSLEMQWFQEDIKRIKLQQELLKLQIARDERGCQRRNYWRKRGKSDIQCSND